MDIFREKNVILILSIEINSHATFKRCSIYSREFFFNYKINEVLMILRITSVHLEFQNNFF